MTETKSSVLVKHHLKQLKLPTMHSECEKTALRAAKENLDHLAYLLALCELELVDRERRAAERRWKAARFPTWSKPYSSAVPIPRWRRCRCRRKPDPVRPGSL
jgi:DNA replication protein DnaC